MIQWCSAAEGEKYQRTATEFNKIISELGPNPLRALKSTPTKKAKSKK